ncbi:MAG: hypothetical protein ACFFB2_11585 [Promethearchaeota archaeon]
MVKSQFLQERSFFQLNENEEYLLIYNILKGENTVLRGLIAEEFVRYILSQRFPILIVRPSIALRYLDNASIKGRYVDFLRKNQQTMDFLGLTPFFRDNHILTTPEETVCRFFYEKEGLSLYLKKESLFPQLQGFIVEVKSRTSENSWAPFNYSFSTNQIEMFQQSKDFDFTIVLCGVTFTSDWNLSVVFCDENQKVLPQDFFVINQYG